IRLVHGCNLSEGRLEIFYQNRWGTICDDKFDIVAAHIACRQLGYSQAERFKCCGYFGQGNGRIWMDNLVCHGNESSLHECSHNGWSIHNCNHQEDVGIICIKIQLRLQNGKTHYEGRLEILNNGEWGTVCSDYFDELAANVACRQLGYVGALDYACCARFGLGGGPIWLDDIRCNGSERSLIECSMRPFSCSDCDHFQDVGLICKKIRLVGSNDTQTGRLEIYANNQWGTVCDDLFQVDEAGVACRELGYANAKAVHSASEFGSGTGPIWLDNVFCQGNETSLLDCSYKALGRHDCSHSEDVGISCFAVNPDIRLANGGSFYGRIEIKYNNVWGTLCDNHFDIRDAKVICRQLGFMEAHRIQSYGPGTGPIYIDELNCRGYESNIFQCSHNGFEKHNCYHRQDVGVECLPCM
ncbi:uncharacterized protein TRIADDRAFT_30641, partial [Trichoplax adhaerens]